MYCSLHLRNAPPNSAVASAKKGTMALGHDIGASVQVHQTHPLGHLAPLCTVGDRYGRKILRLLRALTGNEVVQRAKAVADTGRVRWSAQLAT